MRKTAQARQDWERAGHGHLLARLDPNGLLEPTAEDESLTGLLFSTGMNLATTPAPRPVPVATSRRDRQAEASDLADLFASV